MHSISNSNCSCIVTGLHSGTPEIGGLTTIQAMELLRGCQGLDIVGGDVTEVMRLIICAPVGPAV